jgi:NAD(P)H dehydrogenase (quinone)
MLIPLLHHGMVITGVPYSVPELNTTSSGGTPYGPSHHAGADNRNPISEEEGRVCLALGKRMGQLALRLQS